MSVDNWVQIVEIDIDTCSLTFGSSPCAATLGGTTVRKCYNTFSTCAAKSVYAKASKTIKFCTKGVDIPGYIPALVSAGGYEQQVNIYGMKGNIGSLGVRASVDIVIDDFPDADTLMDKYWQGRIDGSAQIDEGGYDPFERGSFWSKFKARNPNYAGRAIRVIDATVDVAGTLTILSTRHYFMSTISGPGNSAKVTITAKDALYLADNEKAMCPNASRGVVYADFDDSATTFTLAPSGIGNAEYPASGFVMIGSEIVSFTRSGDTMTITRALKGTTAASHSANDTVQLCYNISNRTLPNVLNDLLITYGGLTAAQVDQSGIASEYSAWGSSYVHTATIAKPTKVTTLLAELNQIGVTIWWDEVDGLVKMRLPHPQLNTVNTLSDDYNIISSDQSDNDADRITQVTIWSVQKNPVNELSTTNFYRAYINIDADAASANMYNGTQNTTVYTRWFNQGADNAIRDISARFLSRFTDAPREYTIVVDAVDDYKLCDVVNLETYIDTDVTGAVVTQPCQVYYRKNDHDKAHITLKLQRFMFGVSFGVWTEDDRPDYDDSTAAQKALGTYWSDGSNFSDGRKPYDWV